MIVGEVCSGAAEEVVVSDVDVVLVLKVVLILELDVEPVAVDKDDIDELTLAFFWYKLNLLPAPQYSNTFPTTQTRNRQQ